jgi:hypothetical protein
MNKCTDATRGKQVAVGLTSMLEVSSPILAPDRLQQFCASNIARIIWLVNTLTTNKKVEI